MKDYIEHLRNQSEQVRKTIALSTAGAITAVVALGWVIALASSGSLSLAPTTASSDFNATLAEGQQRFNAVAGAAAALNAQSTGEPSVTIVEEDRSSTLDRNEPAPEETVIHF